MDQTSTPPTPTGTMTAEEESRTVAALGEVFDLARQGDAAAAVRADRTRHAGQPAQ